jgi:hypothetical protein
MKIFELQELRWPSMVVGENILALTLGRRAPGRRGAVGHDPSCKRLSWLWEGDRPEGRSNGGGDHWSSPVKAMEGGAAGLCCRRGPSPGMLSCRRGRGRCTVSREGGEVAAWGSRGGKGSRPGA